MKDKIVYKNVVNCKIKEVKDTERKVLAVVSKEIKDSDGDIVKIDGINLDRYIKTGAPLMWAHRHSDPPIGKCTLLEKVNDELIAEFEYADASTYSFADTIYRLTKEGYINSYSIGFKPDWAATKNLDNGRYMIEKCELLEISATPLPSNPEANVISASLNKALEAKVIDEVEKEEVELYLKNAQIMKEMNDALDEIESDDTDVKTEQTIVKQCKDCGSDLICPICDQIHKSQDEFQWLLSDLETPSPDPKEDAAKDVLKSIGL